MTNQERQPTSTEPVATSDEQTIEIAASEEEVPKKTRFGLRKKRAKKERIRLIPIWLRLIVVTVLVGGSLLLGIIMGYGVIGDGDPKDALKTETWYHILDIMQGNE
ncbi:DNA-directed RNA polymerase subunit beta [Bacillus sp. FJAT-45037]|uniref:DNA-directed RNA polymerase subunit beta n=1 Tax=Bacillus sp. FJAT-45037 TaxID=2011007 RepID=UPI000C236402|nr:DNA-directed RNA polymerase subunit beta [Bacillus sp. FJAT-45037]